MNFEYSNKVKDLQDEMKRLQNPISQVILLSESIARSFEDSFVGIIKGTMSVGDAFRNMFSVSRCQKKYCLVFEANHLPATTTSTTTRTTT